MDVMETVAMRRSTANRRRMIVAMMIHGSVFFLSIANPQRP